MGIKLAVHAWTFSKLERLTWNERMALLRPCVVEQFTVKPEEQKTQQFFVDYINTPLNLKVSQRLKKSQLTTVPMSFLQESDWRKYSTMRCRFHLQLFPTAGSTSNTIL